MCVTYFSHVLSVTRRSAINSFVVLKFIFYRLYKQSFILVFNQRIKIISEGGLYECIPLLEIVFIFLLSLSVRVFYCVFIDYNKNYDVVYLPIAVAVRKYELIDTPLGQPVG